VSGENFTLSICEDCGFVFTNPRPFISDAAPYYESEAYVSHSKTKAGMINNLFHLSRLYTIAYKKRIIRKYSKGKNILDYGCGTGEFLKSMASSGYHCHGIEPNLQAREKASSDKRLIVNDESDLKNIKDGSLHVITLWHVLEHVYPLRERLNAFERMLADEGMLFVAVPNMLSYDAKKYGPHWAAWDVPRHVHHFSPRSIKRLLENQGFEFVESKALLLDAFYISMLSEKYAHGKSKNFHAMINGLKSNLKAFVGDHNYSSLIYIFKKSK
jgi:2-polyprenyl-3-methyl-5-hydroxy-6-metoxy-1,4-benzoquinol methylase